MAVTLIKEGKHTPIPELFEMLLNKEYTCAVCQAKVSFSEASDVIALDHVPQLRVICPSCEKAGVYVMSTEHKHLQQPLYDYFVSRGAMKITNKKWQSVKDY